MFTVQFHSREPSLCMRQQRGGRIHHHESLRLLRVCTFSLKTVRIWKEKRALFKEMTATTGCRLIYISESLHAGAMHLPNTHRSVLNRIAPASALCRIHRYIFSPPPPLPCSVISAVVLCCWNCDRYQPTPTGVGSTRSD